MRREHIESAWEATKIVSIFGFLILSLMVGARHVKLAHDCEHRGGIYVKSYFGFHYYCAAGRK